MADQPQITDPGFYVGGNPPILQDATNKNPLEGFKLDKLKSNLALGVSKDFYDPTLFFKDYLERYANHNEAAPGIPSATITKDIFDNVQKEGIGWFDKAKQIGYRQAIETDVRDALSSGEWVSAPFNALKIAESKKVGGQGITDAHVIQAATQIGDQIKSDFADRFGRDPTQAEASVIFNRLDFPSTTLVNPDSPDQIKTLLSRTGSYEGTLKDFESKLPMLDQANLDLKNIGKELSPEDLNKVLAPGLSPDRAQVFADSIVNSYHIADAKQKLAEVQPKQLAAVDTLQSDLIGQNAASLDRLTPSIASALKARLGPGFRAGPELAAILSEISGRMVENVNTVTTPLRAQARLGAPEAAFNFALGGAAQAGRGLDTAQNFLNSTNILGKQQNFSAGESALNRSSASELSRFQSAMQMALMGGTPSGPGGLDYFLAYGLPALTSLLGSFAGPAGAIAGGAAGGAGGRYLQSQYGNSRNA